MGHSGGYTPLYKAVQRKHEAIVKLLLNDKRVNPNFGDNYGWTPLIQAAWDGNVVVVRMLLEAGVDVGVVNTRGFTALDYARSRSHGAVERLLLDYKNFDR